MRVAGLTRSVAVIALFAAFFLPGVALSAGLGLDYELTLTPGASTIPVTLVIRGLESRPVTLRLTDNYAGVDDYYRAVVNIHSDVPTERVDGWTLHLKSGSASEATVRYELDLRGPGNASDRGKTLPALDHVHAFLPGASVFIFPDIEDGSRHESGIDRIRVRFRKPPSWTIATSWGQGDDEYVFNGKDLNDLLYSFSVLGDYRTSSRTLEGLTVNAAIRGSGLTSDGEIAEFVFRILRAHRQTFGVTPFAGMLIIGDFFYSNGTTAGNASHNTINLVMPKDRTLSEHAAFRNLIAHETFHLWNGGDGVIAYGNYDVLWVSEGITDYYAQRNLWRAGLIDEADFLDEVAGKLLRLQTSVVREFALSDAGKRFFEDSRMRNLVYTKGALAGFLLDQKLRTTSGERKSLDDVMRALAARRSNIQRGERYVHADMLSAIEYVGGPDLLNAFRSFAEGKGFWRELEIVVGAANLKLEALDQEGYTLGIFDVGPRFQTPVLRALDPDGPAYRAGLREGDRILELDEHVTRTYEDLARALAGVGSGTGTEVSLLVERDGYRLHFNVAPKRFHKYVLEKRPPEPAAQ